MPGSSDPGFDTLALHAGASPDAATGARAVPIHPTTSSHVRMDAAALARAGIGAGTIRLSIGLEDPDDPIDDLKRALRAAEKAAA